MTRHRTITGFVAVALLAVAATAATLRSHSPWSEGIVVSAGTTMLKGAAVLTSAGPRYQLRQWTRLSASSTFAECRRNRPIWQNL